MMSGGAGSWGDEFNPETIGAAKVLWDYHCTSDVVVPSDAIIGLGSYDVRVALRCAELFHAGIAPRIVFTGRHGNWTANIFDRSEAAIFAEEALLHGVPRDAIELEEQATNIGENILFAARLIKGSTPSVTVVTKPQTQRRCAATAARQWPQARVATTAPGHSFLEQPTADFPLGHLIHEMVGDMDRILSYPARGFMEKQDVPQQVSAALRMLVERGFTGHPL